MYYSPTFPKMDFFDERCLIGKQIFWCSLVQSTFLDMTDLVNCKSLSKKAVGLWKYCHKDKINGMPETCFRLELMHTPQHHAYVKEMGPWFRVLIPTSPIEVARIWFSFRILC